MSKANDYTNGLTARLELAKLTREFLISGGASQDSIEKRTVHVLEKLSIQQVMERLPMFRQWPLLVTALQDVHKQLGDDNTDIDSWLSSAFDIVATHGITQEHVLWEWCEQILHASAT